MAVDKAALLDSSRVLPHDVAIVPGVGEVEVRGLSRAEVIQMQTCGNVDEMEVKTLAFGMVDPSLTEDEIRQWRSTKGSDEVRPVSDKILELSGMLPDQQTDKERSFRAESGDG